MNNRRRLQEAGEMHKVHKAHEPHMVHKRNKLRLLSLLLAVGFAFPSLGGEAGTAVICDGPGESVTRDRAILNGLPSEAGTCIIVEVTGLTAWVGVYTREKPDSEEKLYLEEKPDTKGNLDTTGNLDTKENLNTKKNLNTREKPDSEEDKCFPGTGWQLRLYTEEGRIGRKGLGKEREGDEKTPAGIFKMNTPFGTAAPEEGFPAEYIQLTDSMYWVGDQSSRWYNRFADRTVCTDFNPSDSEHLSTIPGYTCCIDTGYNTDCVPGKGSAIFLHCSVEGKNTSGCIAVPEDVMRKIMKLYREGKTYIAIYEARQ